MQNANVLETLTILELEQREKHNTNVTIPIVRKRGFLQQPTTGRLSNQQMNSWCYISSFNDSTKVSTFKFQRFNQHLSVLHGLVHLKRLIRRILIRVMSSKKNLKFDFHNVFFLGHCKINSRKLKCLINIRGKNDSCYHVPSYKTTKAARSK